MEKRIRIGTRGSKLAMVQACTVKDGLEQHHRDLDVEIVEINSSAEWKPEQGETRLSEAHGGKGLFAKEIEEAILDAHVDCGVHSLKDMPSFLTQGLEISHTLPREDVREALLMNDRANSGSGLENIPQDATIGTSSMRRQSILQALRPDLKFVPFRGNVPTRIEKLCKGQVDVTILACAGIKRLGLEDEISLVLEVEEMLPAAGQGAVCLEIRNDDNKTRELLCPLHCAETFICVTAERAALQALDGSCHTPIGAYAIRDGAKMHLRVLVADPQGNDLREIEQREIIETPEQAQKFGFKLGTSLKDDVPPEWLEE